MSGMSACTPQGLCSNKLKTTQKRTGSRARNHPRAQERKAVQHAKPHQQAKGEVLKRLGQPTLRSPNIYVTLEKQQVLQKLHPGPRSCQSYFCRRPVEARHGMYFKRFLFFHSQMGICCETCLSWPCGLSSSDNDGHAVAPGAQTSVCSRALAAAP